MDQRKKQKYVELQPRKAGVAICPVCLSVSHAAGSFQPISLQSEVIKSARPQ